MKCLGNCLQPYNRNRPKTRTNHIANVFEMTSSILLDGHNAERKDSYLFLYFLFLPQIRRVSWSMRVHVWWIVRCKHLKRRKGAFYTIPKDILLRHFQNDDDDDVLVPDINGPLYHRNRRIGDKVSVRLYTRVLIPVLVLDGFLALLSIILRCYLYKFQLSLVRFPLWRVCCPAPIIHVDNVCLFLRFFLGSFMCCE